MRRSTLWMCALLVTATLGCKQVNEQIAKIRRRSRRAADGRPPRRPRPGRTGAAGADTAIGGQAESERRAKPLRPAQYPRRSDARRPVQLADTAPSRPG